MLSGSQVEAGNLVFHKFSMQSFTFAGGHFEFPIASKYHLLLRSFIGTYVPNFI